MKSKELRKVLLQNPQVLLSRKSTRAILCDVFTNDMAIVNAMLFAFDSHIIDSLRSHAPLTPADRARYTKILTQDYAIVDVRAKEAIDNWNDAYDPSISKLLDSIEASLQAKEAEKQNEIEQNAVTESIETDPLQIEANALLGKDDDENYYVNPIIQLRDDRIYIPCGVGNSDNGFFIYGINKTDECKNPNSSIYALVYNFLVRNSQMTDDDIPKCIQTEDSVFALDYRSIYRTAITILQLVKNNYWQHGKDNKGNEIDIITLDFHDDMDVLRIAKKMINFYLALFSRLMRVAPVRLHFKIGEKGIQFSLNGNKGIFVRDNTEFISNARELWYGKKINYKLSRDNIEDLEYLLAEVSPFDSFKEGQFEILCKMVSAKKHTVCIMPTGSGKSLIFYLISFLQPLPIFIIAPTDILIQDQIRNLKLFHRIDNVAHLQLTEENTFRHYEMFNNLNYITPNTLQNVYLLQAFRKINMGIVSRLEHIVSGQVKMVKEHKLSAYPLFSYIVLDEIHCISNWSHDFRPEYLMLSEKMKKYLDQIVYLGFTATANYTVVEDVQKQLSVPQENFLSPISFEKNNISYDYICATNQGEMLEVVSNVCQETTRRNERTIVFTKNDDVSRKVAEAIGYEADVFTKEYPVAYHHFAEGKCRVLVASDELGVGINFPNIRNVIHFGLPLSKSEYIQEIGRAGRANEMVHSYVIYLSKENAPENLLKRDIQVKDIPEIISDMDNDYSDIYKRLTNNSPTSELLYQRIMDCYNKFVQGKQVRYVESFRPNESVEARRILYMLYVVGYVNDWYSFSKSSDSLGTDYSIDICSTDAEEYRKNPEKMLQRMKSRTRRYFDAMGDSWESVSKAGKAAAPEELIRIYVEWYFNHYLYHQNEQFMDLYEFISGNAQSDDEITLAIKDYFMLPFIKLKSIEAQFSEMNIKEVGNKVLAGVTASMMNDIERINSNRYSYKLDFFLLTAGVKYYGVLEQSRYDRLRRYCNDFEWRYMVSFWERLYPQCETKGRLAILNCIANTGDYKQGVPHFLDVVYANEAKDIVYYGLLAKSINKIFNGSRR